MASVCLFLLGIVNDDQLFAFTGCGNGPAPQRVDMSWRCFDRPTTILLLTREDGKHIAPSLIEAVTVQLTLTGALGLL